MEWNGGFSAREVVKRTAKTLQTRLIELSVEIVLQKDSTKGFSIWKDQRY